MKNTKDRTMGGERGGRKTGNCYVAQAGGEAAEPGEIVVMSVSGTGKNMSYDHAFALGWWLDDGLGWELDGVELAEFTVHAWCDLEPYGG